MMVPERWRHIDTHEHDRERRRHIHVPLTPVDVCGFGACVLSHPRPHAQACLHWSSALPLSSFLCARLGFVVGIGGGKCHTCMGGKCHRAIRGGKCHRAHAGEPCASSAELRLSAANPILRQGGCGSGAAAAARGRRLSCPTSDERRTKDMGPTKTQTRGPDTRPTSACMALASASLHFAARPSHLLLPPFFHIPSDLAPRPRPRCWHPRALAVFVAMMSCAYLVSCSQCLCP